MRLVCIADQHGYLPEDLPSGDVLIVAGDISPISDHKHLFQRLWLEGNFTQWANSLDFEKIIVIAGNHDFYLQEPRFPENPFPLPNNITYLEDSACEINGWKFWGSPWSNRFGNWAFMADEHLLATFYDDIPSDTDVIISHGPPMGYGDFTDSNEYAGSTSLRKRVHKIRPRLVVCGHIHEGYGKYPLTGGQVINASLRDSGYEVANPPVVLDLS